MATPSGTPSVDADIARAIATHFEGDGALHAAFAEACVTQFVADRAIGRAACAGGDLDRLRRLAHDLGSALRVLGHVAASAQASQLERCAQSGDLPGARDIWFALELTLAEVSRSPRA